MLKHNPPGTCWGKPATPTRVGEPCSCTELEPHTLPPTPFIHLVSSHRRNPTLAWKRISAGLNFAAPLVSNVLILKGGWDGGGPAQPPTVNTAESLPGIKLLFYFLYESLNLWRQNQNTRQEKNRQLVWISGTEDVMGIPASKKRRYMVRLKTIWVAFLNKWNVLLPEMGYSKPFMSKGQKIGSARPPRKEWGLWVHKIVAPWP